MLACTALCIKVSSLKSIRCDVTTICDTIKRSSFIVSLTSDVGAGSRLHDLGGASITIFFISSGVGKTKEDSIDMQQLLIFSCFSPFILSELRDNSRQMLLIFSENGLKTDSPFQLRMCR